MSGSSASFEQSCDDLEAADPPSKRARLEAPEIAPEPAAEVAVMEGEGGEEVHLTVPQTQFEIEINSGTVEEEVGRETILRQDLSGPAFSITTAAQDLPSLSTLSQSDTDESVGERDGGTLNAIGRALIQMQQTGTGTSHSGSTHQLILTSPQGDTSQNSSSPLYVMIPPSSSAEILQAMGQSRPIAPKGLATLSDKDGLNANREAQRKATHNEVERRRRDRINDMIKTLAQIVPGCQKKDATTGNVVGYVYSKGTVLDKTVEYLKDLIAQNEQLSTTAKLADKSANALSLLQNQISLLEKENAFLRAQIIQLGIDVTTSSQTAALSRQLLSSPLQGLLNPPAPSTSSSQSTAQQLILSLAQSLSGNTLLGQTHTPAPAITSITTPSPPSIPPLTSLTPSQLASSLNSVSPALAVSNSSPLISTSPSSQTPSLTTPLLSSLVQTLASIANTNTTPSTPIPKVTPLSTPLSSLGSQGLSSATAAASLLSTLLLAQNILSMGSGQGEGSSGIASSVLNNVSVDNKQSTS